MCWTFNIWTPPIIRATVWFWMQRCLTTKKNEKRDGAKFRFQICHAILWSADVHQKYVYGIGCLFEWCSFESLFWIFNFCSIYILKQSLKKIMEGKYTKKAELIQTLISALIHICVFWVFLTKIFACFHIFRNVKPNLTWPLLTSAILN